jgi:heme-degrading monooxygenase HmoA
MTASLMRIWRGRTRRSDADAYETYMRATGLIGYLEVEGNRGVHMTRRDIDGDTEFCLVSFWDSWDAVRRFAGVDPARAVFYPEDDRFLVERELVVSHYTIFESA